jgi:hypothetical protein
MRTIKTLLLSAAALAAVAAPATAASYFYRSKPTVSPPQPFSFATASDLGVAASATSPVTRVRGYGGKTASVSGDVGAAYQICATADCSDQVSWKTAASAGLGDDFYARVQVTTGPLGASRTATLEVGATPATAGQDPVSAILRLTSHDGIPVSVTGTGASYRLCADSTCSTSPQWTTSAGTAVRDAYVQMKAPAPAANTTALVATLSYGSRTAAWSVTSPAAGYSGTYALATKNNGTKKLAFVYLPANTVISGDAGYEAFCEARGFTGNKSSNGYFNNDPAGKRMYSATEYVSTTACMFLQPVADNQAATITSFENFGLPTGTALRIRDRGCWTNWGATNGGINTSDTLVVSGPTAFQYTPNGSGASDWSRVKGDSFANNGVIICQAK